MSDYRASIRYARGPAAVYDAVARPGDWWTARGGVAAREGDLMRLDWSDDDFAVFRLDLLDRPRAMRWTCVEQHDSNLPEPGEWVGTTLSFAFRDEGGATTLDFVHHGLVPALDCYEMCDGGWDFFLRHSLRRLIEAGSGLPHCQAGAASE